MNPKSSKKLKIAIVAPSMKDVGGQSIQAQRLIDAFSDDDKIELTLIPNNPELKLFSFLQDIPIIKTLVTSLKFWWMLLTRTNKFEMIQIFSSGTTSYIISTIPPLLVAKLFGKKAVLNYHHGGLEEHVNEWKLTAKPTMKMFNEIVVPSQFLVDVFTKLGLKAQAISNFVEMEKFIFRERNPLRPDFLANRNFEPHYNVECVLRAFQTIQKQIPEASLIVAGYGVEASKLKNLAASLKLQNIEFTGKIPNEKMPEIYNRADIYLNASLVDNMPLSFIEAFSCGLPIVSSNAGGIPYIVKDGETGFLVDKNDCETLAEKSFQLLQNNDLAQKIISNSRRECEKYFRDKVRNDWEKFYIGENDLN